MRTLSFVTLATALRAILTMALAQQKAAGDGMKAIGTPSSQKRVDALLVLNAQAAKLAGQTLVLEGTLPSAILFADRPVRSAGHIPMKEVADGPASIFIDTIWFGIGSGGVRYLGQNATTGGMTPAIGSQYDTSTYSGWPNPSPNEPPRRPPPGYGLTAPPGMR